MVPNRVHCRKDAEYQLAKAMKSWWVYPGDFEGPLTFSQRLHSMTLLYRHFYLEDYCFDISLSECVFNRECTKGCSNTNRLT